MSITKTKQIRVVLLVLLIYIAILHLIPYIYGRSLYIDEAMLASSIQTRSLATLFSKPLDWDQSAPMGYILIVKVFSIIGQGTKLSLRCWSLISFFGTAVLLYRILNQILKLKCSVAFPLIFSLLPYYIRYASEVKQYMSDTFFVLLVLYVYWMYNTRKVSEKKLIIAFSIIVWFSFSAILFIAGCMIILLVKQVRLDCVNRRIHIVKYLWMSMTAVSFALCYLLWLRQTRSNAGDLEYWNYLRFPLIPKSEDDLALIVKMCQQMLKPLWFGGNAYFALIVILFIASFFNEDKEFFAPLGTSLLLLIIASAIGFYPIQDRLVQFISAILLIPSAVGFDVLYTKIHRFVQNKCIKLPIDKVMAVVVIIYLIETPLLYSIEYLFPQKNHLSGSEVSYSIKYLDEHFTENDMVYVNLYSIPVFDYETDYRFQKVKSLYHQSKPTVNGKILFGSEIIKKGRESAYEYNDVVDIIKVKKEVDFIKEFDTVYLFTSHIDKGVYKIAERLEKFGTVIVVSDYYNTRLLYYIKRK